MITCNLIVLRCADIDVTRDFYESLGLVFVQEQHHANSPIHFSTQVHDLVIELYPATASKPVDSCRLGFSINDWQLANQFGKTPMLRESNYFFTLTDPDGRVVEIVIN